MTSVAHPSGQARDPVPSIRMVSVYQEGRKIGVVLSPEVCSILAGQSCNLEELGELVRKIVGAIRDHNQPFTPELVGKSLQEWAKPKPVPSAKVLQAVAEYFGVTVDDLEGLDRHKDITLPRQVAMFLLRELCPLSTTKIGIRLGGRDHSTVMYGQKEIEKRCKEDPGLRQGIKEITTKLLRAQHK